MRTSAIRAEVLILLRLMSSLDARSAFDNKPPAMRVRIEGCTLAEQTTAIQG